MSDADDGFSLSFPIEFIVMATPRSHQSANNKAKEAWKARVGQAAKSRIEESQAFWLLDARPLSATIFYFLPAPMQGDVDNIVKLIIDGMLFIIYPDDRVVERIVAQKFEPDVLVEFRNLTRLLEGAAAAEPPVLYVRIDDDMSWRRVP